VKEITNQVRQALMIRLKPNDFPSMQQSEGSITGAERAAFITGA
jgi:hypothetical protein